jgi:hypothetical protein
VNIGQFYCPASGSVLVHGVDPDFLIAPSPRVDGSRGLTSLTLRGGYSKGDHLGSIPIALNAARNPSGLRDGSISNFDLCRILAPAAAQARSDAFCWCGSRDAALCEQTTEIRRIITGLALPLRLVPGLNTLPPPPQLSGPPNHHILPAEIKIHQGGVVHFYCSAQVRFWCMGLR